MPLQFQSPNGVQIALYSERGEDPLRKVSITKRCTDCFSGVGVQLPDDMKFQSPNGVQIAFAARLKRCKSPFVSITKRCTDCFLTGSIRTAWKSSFNHQTVYRLLFKVVSRQIHRGTAFQSPNGVQIAF